MKGKEADKRKRTRLNLPPGIIILVADSLYADPLFQLLHGARPAEAAVRLLVRTLQNGNPSPISRELLSWSIHLGVLVHALSLSWKMWWSHLSLNGCCLSRLQFQAVDLGEGTSTLCPVLLEAIALSVTLLSVFFLFGGGYCSTALTINLKIAFIVLDFRLRERQLVVDNMTDFLRPTLFYF